MVKVLKVKRRQFQTFIFSYELNKMREQTTISEQVVEIGKKYSTLFLAQPRYTQAETIAAMKGIAADVSRLEKRIFMIADRQQTTLLNVVHFDIRKVLQTLGYIRSDIILLDGCDDAIKSVENMICKVREIEVVIKKIEGSPELQLTIYNKMIENYQTSKWLRDYQKFVHQVKEEVAEEVKKGKPALDVLKGKLRNMRQTRLESYMPAHVKRLYDSVVAADSSTYEAIVLGRNELSEDDIADFFSFLFRYSTLKWHIDSVPLLNPVIGDNDKLFTCWAAKKYVTLLSPALIMFGGIQEKGHIPILLMLMKDLGLSPIGNKPFVQMKDYANEMSTDEGLKFDKDHSIFSKMFGWLGEGNRFCELEWGDVGNTQFMEDHIQEYQDVYWRCFTILNQRGLRKPNEIKVASYLKNPHPALSMNVVMDNYTSEQLIRLNFLRSTIRRETLVFG